MKIKLNRPITINGVEMKEIELDFDKLTGADLISASRESGLLGDNALVPELSKQYLAVVAAKASGLNVDDIMKLSAKDFTAVTLTVQNFCCKWPGTRSDYGDISISIHGYLYACKLLDFNAIKRIDSMGRKGCENCEDRGWQEWQLPMK